MQRGKGNPCHCCANRCRWGKAETKQLLTQRYFAYAQYDASNIVIPSPWDAPSGCPHMYGLRLHLRQESSPHHSRHCANRCRWGKADSTLRVFSSARKTSPCRKSLSPRQSSRTARPISFWLRFFLFGRSKKKEMNKTDSYATGYFASFRANANPRRDAAFLEKLSFVTI